MRFMHGAAHASLKPTAGPRRHRKSVDAKYAKEKKRERKELRRRGRSAQTLAINVHRLSSSFRLHPCLTHVSSSASSRGRWLTSPQDSTVQRLSRWRSTLTDALKIGKSRGALSGIPVAWR